MDSTFDFDLRQVTKCTSFEFDTNFDYRSNNARIFHIFSARVRKKKRYRLKVTTMKSFNGTWQRAINIYTIAAILH